MGGWALFPSALVLFNLNLLKIKRSFESFIDLIEKDVAMCNLEIHAQYNITGLNTFLQNKVV